MMPTFVDALLCAMLLSAAPQESAPRILFNTSPRAVEYQLNRLSNDQLMRVERSDGDVKYRPVYLALLTRKAMARPIRAEALAALVKIDGTTPTRVLLAALAKVPVSEMTETDAQNLDTLLGMLLGQPADTLRQQRAVLALAAAEASEPLVRRGAYGAIMIADGDPAPAWQAAAKLNGHLVELLRSVPHLGKADQLRARLSTPVAALLAETKDPGTRTAAIAALDRKSVV